MRIFKYYQFIKEAEEILQPTEKSDQTEDSIDISKYSELKDEISEMIKASLDIGDIKTFEDFIEAFIKYPEDTKIEGLINASDIYEFYLKWRSDVDDVLSEINFYDEVPSEMKVFSLYEYITQGTLKAVSEIVSMFK